MPLMEMPDGADEKRREKVYAGRQKMLAKAMEKYRFKFEGNCLPDGLLVEGGRLVGLRFRRTRIEGNKVIPLDETFERRGVYTISSIGSVPKEIPGVPMKGELFAFTDWDIGRLADYPTVFSAGNVVTGKGNIVASRKHAREVSGTVLEAFLGVAEGGHAGEEQLAEALAADAREAARQIADAIAVQPAIGADALAGVRERVTKRQQAVGYDGDYHAWVRDQ
jgi:hypothetical protein